MTRTAPRSRSSALRLACSVLLLLAAQACRGPEVDASRIATRIERLASAEFYGRETGSFGGLRARAYVANAFAELGLEPFGDDGYEQRFQVFDPRPRAASSASRLRSDAGEARLGEDFMPFRFSAVGTARGPAVYVGHGIDAPEFGIDDYAGLDVTGCVVIALRGGASLGLDATNFEAFLRHREFATKAEVAAMRGAVAMVVFDHGGGDEPLRAASRARGAPASIPIVLVSRLDSILPNWRDSARPIDRELEVRVAFEHRDHPPLDAANLIGVVRGERERPVVVVGAHYDHLGVGARIGGDRPGVGHFPGADDNASGVAAMLEVAALVAAGPRPVATVAFVAFDAEEFELAGSRKFCREGPFRAADVAVMLNFEMVGRTSTGGLLVDGVGSASELGSVLRGIEWPPNTRLRDHAEPRSDHWPFLLSGIPAIAFGGSRHSDYHTRNDRPEGVDANSVGDVALAAFEVVRRLAARGERLDFDASVIRASYFSNR